jgi:exonuclease III
MPLRLMTYNILTGGVSREKYIQEVIQSANPDVVVLQEVTDVEVLKSIARSLQMQWFLGEGNQKTRVALLSRLPILNFKSYHPRIPIWHNVIEAEVEYQPNKSFVLMGVHLIPHLWIGFEVWRYLEVKYVLNLCKEFSRQPLLVAGDFNAIALGDDLLIKSSTVSIKAMLFLQGNYVFRFALQALLSAGFMDSFRFRHPKENGFTYPTAQRSTRFDYVFVNPVMQKHLKECWIVREPKIVIQASDHYPVLAEFDLDI